MGWIKSKVIPNARWEIRWEILYKGNKARYKGSRIRHERALRLTPEIIQRDYEFIANLNPILYCNDLTGKEWAFDIKLPTGGYLENINATWAKDGTRIFRALMFC